MSLTNFLGAQLSYAEIKHSDWLKIVLELGTAIQCALFTLKFVNDIDSRLFLRM